MISENLYVVALAVEQFLLHAATEEGEIWGALHSVAGIHHKHIWA